MRGWIALVCAELAALLVLLSLWLGQGGERTGEQVLLGSAPEANAQVELSVSAASMARHLPGVALEAEARREPRAIAVLLVGAVRDREGRPVPEASISAQQFDRWQGTSGAANGAYALAGLSPGRWELRCDAEGFGEHQQSIVLDERPRQRVDFELAPSVAIEVFLRTMNGAPLEGNEHGRVVEHLAVVASAEPLEADFPPFSHRHIQRFGIGSFEPPTRAPSTLIEGRSALGRLVLHHDPPAYAALYYRHVWLQTLPVAPGQKELEFVLEPNALAQRASGVALRVVAAESGLPIAGATVELNTSQAGGGGKKTDAEGRVRIADFHPGIGELRIHAREREYAWRQVLLRAGEVAELGDIAVGKVVPLAGVVVDAAGKPVAGAQVSWVALDTREPGTDLSARSLSTCDVEGRFSIPNLGPHRYRMQGYGDVRQEGYAAVDLSSGAPAEARLVLSAEWIPITVRGPSDPLAHYSVTALDAQEVPIDEITFGGTIYRTWLKLPPGRVAIEIRGTGGALVRRFDLDVTDSAAEIVVP
jgi:hypothetical protein